MPYPPGILARGPWPLDRVTSRWSETPYEPSPDKVAAADRAIADLKARSSPSHDGLAGRLESFTAVNGRLELQLQEMRWALRLLREDASGALSVLCVVRDCEGRWLAGRRAAWVATWAGVWALGAGGAVDAG